MQARLADVVTWTKRSARFGWRRHDPPVVAAHLAQGRIHLQRDPAQAYSDYDAAFRVGAEGEAGRLAHLGMATALEYLDRREAAPAELMRWWRMERPTPRSSVVGIASGHDAHRDGTLRRDAARMHAEGRGLG